MFCSIKAFLNVFKECACLTDVGKVFHSLRAETVNELVKNDVLVFVTINGPFSGDLRFQLCYSCQCQ